MQLAILLVYLVNLAVAGDATSPAIERAKSGRQADVLPISVGHQFGLIDKNGKVLLKPQFDFIGDISGGLFRNWIQGQVLKWHTGLDQDGGGVTIAPGPPQAHLY